MSKSRVSPGFQFPTSDEWLVAELGSQEAVDSALNNGRGDELYAKYKGAQHAAFLEHVDGLVDKIHNSKLGY